jgi:hypothetical protein
MLYNPRTVNNSLVGAAASLCKQQEFFGMEPEEVLVGINKERAEKLSTTFASRAGRGHAGAMLAV